MKLHSIAGQLSWCLATNEVEAFITRDGGHLAPVVFDRRHRKITPLSIAPWATEKVPADTPQILKALRGDFFCMPFGGNTSAVRGKQYPVHGETANARWSLECSNISSEESTLHLQLRTRIMPGTVDKYVTLKSGHNAVYCRHVIAGMSGRMSFGHHAMLRFPDAPGSGLISTSAFLRGQVAPLPVEMPENRGYSMLKPGAQFQSLETVPNVFGTTSDLSQYPANPGYEDLIMLAANPGLPFAWTAVSFPAERYVWFVLKDPRVLYQTILWISNGGRHYAPWNGRHGNVMGLEEVTSYFHYGLKESIARNPWSDAGIPTSKMLSARKPLSVNTIMAVALTPRGFGRVTDISVSNGKESVTLIDTTGSKVTCPLDVGFLGKQL